ncbi:hypothetical protein P154DRAFT_527713, partial [Amniculicola lignicola CBS 123094]
MKFTSVLYAAVLTAVAAATPVEGKRGVSNIEVVAKDPLIIPVVHDGDKPYIKASGAVTKRSNVMKRTLVVDIWADRDRGGRHEGLISDEQRCYQLGNGWNDQVSSLSVPGGWGCIFYRNNDCGNGDVRLTISNGGYISNLQDYSWEGINFNDMISAYRCWL